MWRVVRRHHRDGFAGHWAVRRYHLGRRIACGGCASLSACTADVASDGTPSVLTTNDEGCTVTVSCATITGRVSRHQRVASASEATVCTAVH